MKLMVEMIQQWLNYSTTPLTWVKNLYFLNNHIKNSTNKLYSEKVNFYFKNINMDYIHVYM